MKRYDIITVGSGVVDIFIYTGLHESVAKGKKVMCYPIGGKIAVNKIHYDIGGGGTNTAVSFSRLGNKVAYLSKLGEDNCKKILDLLKKEKIDFIGKVGKEFNGFSAILDSKEHHRTIFTYKGSNDFLGKNDLDLKKLNTKWFYFSSMLGKSFKTQQFLASYAHKNKIKIAYNPSEYQAKKGIKYLKKILKYTTILILNLEEAQLLSRKKNLIDVIKKLNAAGPKIVCITNASKPVFVYDGNTNLLYSAMPHDIKVAETTGAGDAFASSFVAGIIKTNSIESSIKLAITNSESVIQHIGAKNKLLTLNEAKKKIKKKKIVISKKSM
ncbi:carbohydrate kinase family protein [Candidatus Woesearchaeota archaeon]|nr:carbohydrate kinase family protein [Candidatus Woesearchaeota archaeon]